MLEGDRSHAGGGQDACSLQPAENTQCECRPQRSWQRRKRRLGRLFLKKACAKKLVQDSALKLRTAEESARFLHEELLLLQLVTVGAGIIRAGAEDPGGHWMPSDRGIFLYEVLLLLQFVTVGAGILPAAAEDSGVPGGHWMPSHVSFFRIKTLMQENAARKLEGAQARILELERSNAVLETDKAGSKAQSLG